MLKIYYSLFILLVLLYSCNNEKKEANKMVKEWVGKEIKLPILTANLHGKDTLCPQLFKQNNKILIYIDSLQCIPCRLHFFDWKLLIDEVKRDFPNTAFLIYINSSNINEIDILQKENRFYYPIFYDTENQLDKINNLPKNEQFQTFLLDKNNRVVLIGNPVRNPQMWNLYKKSIK